MLSYLKSKVTGPKPYQPTPKVYPTDSPIIRTFKENNVNNIGMLFLRSDDNKLTSNDVNVSDKNGDTPLIIACKNNISIATVEGLVANGAKINTENTAGQTALDIAKINNNTEIVNFLNEKLADNQGFEDIYKGDNNGGKRRSKKLKKEKRRSKKLKKINRKSKKINRKSKKIY